MHALYGQKKSGKFKQLLNTFRSIVKARGKVKIFKV
jgi:hypothetical protein